MAVTEVPPEVVDAEQVAHHPGSARRPRWRSTVGIWLPTGVIVLVIAACFLGPWAFGLPQPVGGSILDSNLPALSPGHLLGTDMNGNDILSRILHGGRPSLEIAISVNVLGMLVGGTLGALAGYLGGVLDTLLMRVLDVLIAFPSLVLILAVAQALGPSMLHSILALTFFSVPAFARVARAAVLRIRSQPFMVAAELCGTSRPRVLVRHLAPNIAPQVITYGLLSMGTVIIIEGALSFLGLGIARPDPSWGNMISDGQQNITAVPGLVIWPSVALLITVLAFNLLSENLRARWSRQ